MIYFLHGEDIFTARKKMHSILDVLCKKRPDSEIFKMNSETFKDDKFEELIFSQGLFDSKYIVLLDNLFEDKNIKESVLDRLQQMKESPNVFVCLEKKVEAKILKNIEKNAEKVQEFKLKETVKKYFNVFSVADGLVEKNKKKLWIDYLKLVYEGIPTEEIHGIVFWQVKNMAIAGRVDSQKESGLTPYQYKNALSGSRKYSDDEINNMLSSLVLMTHKVRSGEGEIETMFEKWILSL